MTQTPPSRASGRAYRLTEMSPPERRKSLIRALLTMIVSFFAILALYYSVPLSTKELLAAPVLLVILAAAAFLGVLVWQVREILRAELPGLRAAQAVVVAALLLITGYAALYVVLSQPQGSFTEQLTRTSALYFSVTVFSSVGFGDIVPKSELNRLVVTSQMLAGLLFIATVVRVFISASKVGLRRRPSTADDSTGQSSPPDDPGRT
jgi:voltage-gated potassium channel